MDSPHMFANKLLLTLSLAVMIPATTWAQDEVKKKTPTETKFDLSKVIAPRVAKLRTPKLRPEIVGEKLAVASPSAIAREHVKTGFALVHAHWDFEAYRHFCAALKADPDCLMAYAGVALSLAQEFHVDIQYRLEAVLRISYLIQADEEAIAAKKNPRFPAIERKFAGSTAILLTASPRAAGIMFHKLGEEFPHFYQARLLGLFMTRGGYDILGNATPAQQKSIDGAFALLTKNPENPLMMSFWLAMNSEAPTESVNLKRDVLPYARRLAQKHLTVPSWQYFLGHFEWRCGNYLLAERAFSKSAALYEAWMKEDGISMNDCSGYIKAKCYLANSHYQRGNFLEAMKVAKSLRAIKTDPKRPQSEGNQILIWRAYTLPARLYFAHGAAKDMNRAQESLPTAEELKPFTTDIRFPTLAGAYIDALRTYAGVRKAVGDENIKASKTLHTITFRRYLGAMARTAQGASRAPDYPHFLRAGSDLAVYDMELSGIVAGINKEKNSRDGAENWFRSARDKQGLPSQMMPPGVVSPMENRLGDFYAAKGDHARAYAAYAAANKRFPNNMESLRKMMKSLEAQGNKASAEIIRKHINAVKP